MPRNTWQDRELYDATASRLASLFKNNFEKFSRETSADVLAAGPIAARFDE
jgi:phosphoenolpyruvate carboxykinase (ATP)